MKTIINYFKRTHWLRVSVAFLTCLLSLVFPSCQKDFPINNKFLDNVDMMSPKSLVTYPPVVYYGPKTFIRGYGAPFIETLAIENPNFEDFDGNFVLKIQNGSDKITRVSSAEIKIDGVLVINTSDLSKKIPFITKQLFGLTSASVLEVKIFSEPGSFIKLWIEGTSKYLNKPNCRSLFIPKTYDYQIVGFYPSWEQEAMPVISIPWEKLTRIIYFAAIPNADGTINISGLTNTTQLVDCAHAHGVEVYFSVGGGSPWSDNFPEMATNEESRKKFIKEVRQYVFENCLDGVDIDWEYWSGDQNNVVVPAESYALLSIVKDLKREIAPFDLKISIDVAWHDYFGKHFLDEITDYVDYVMVMAYEMHGPSNEPGPHSAFDYAIGSGSDNNSTGLAYWINYRGWPKENILLGVPFYGKNFEQNGVTDISFANIVKQYPDAYNSDQVNNIYYDGINTMANKTQYVVDNKLGGMMIWEIALDSPVESVSLLNTIYNIMHP